MKKVFLSLGLLVGVVGAANAQARFGIKAGVSLASETANSIPGGNKKNLVGLTVGGMADIAFNDLLSFHPELLYSQKGVRYESGSEYIQARTSYIDLPLLLRVNTNGLFFEAGPQLGFLVGQNNEYNLGALGSGSNSKSDGTRKVDFGYIAGLGYRMEQGLEIGLRYNGGLADLNDPSGSTKTYNSVFQFQVGYLFPAK